MREGLLLGSSNWVLAPKGVSMPSRDETEYSLGRLRWLTVGGRGTREEGAVQANCSIFLSFGLNTKLCIYRVKKYKAGENPIIRE